MPENLSLLQNSFEGIDTKFIVLLVDEETILARDKERREDWQMGPRCLELLQDFKEAEYPKQNILDTSKLSVEETVKEILNQNQFQLKK